MKSLLVKYETMQDAFHMGDLVIHEDNEMIVLVNSITNEACRFNGTLIVRGKSCVALGVYEKSYYKNDFKLFHGEIKLTQ